MIENKIFCDSCNHNIGESNGCPGYILNLKSIPSRLAGETYDVYITNPIPRELHFCGFACLNKYLEGRGN